eukprot:g1837.t1
MADSTFDTTGDGHADFDMMNLSSKNAFDDVDDDFQIHIYVTMRNGRKCTSTIQGLHLIPFPADKFEGINYKKIVKYMKRSFKCNGSVQTDSKTGTTVITLSGNKTNEIRDFLVDHELCQRKQIVIHGL